MLILPKSSPKESRSGKEARNEKEMERCDLSVEYNEIKSNWRLTPTPSEKGAEDINVDTLSQEQECDEDLAQVDESMGIGPKVTHLQCHPQIPRWIVLQLFYSL